MSLDMLQMLEELGRALNVPSLKELDLPRIDLAWGDGSRQQWEQIGRDLHRAVTTGEHDLRADYLKANLDKFPKELQNFSKCEKHGQNNMEAAVGNMQYAIMASILRLAAKMLDKTSEGMADRLSGLMKSGGCVKAIPLGKSVVAFNNSKDNAERAACSIYSGITASIRLMEVVDG